MNSFSHLDSEGQPSMVDIGTKKISKRTAQARTIVVLPQNILDQFENGDIQTVKGSVFQTAILAGVMAAKKTGELIPLCHPLGLDHCQVRIHLNALNELIIDCTASLEGKTGVEMEALVGSSIAALTVYDMCKAFSHDIVIKETRLISKTGGKRDFQHFTRNELDNKPSKIHEK